MNPDPDEVPLGQKVDALRNEIAYKRKCVEDSLKAERELASVRNSNETAISNALIQLSKELNCELGPQLARRLTEELVRVTGWKPPTLVS